MQGFADIPNTVTLQAMAECESDKELEELTIDNINNLEFLHFKSMKLLMSARFILSTSVVWQI